MRVTEIISSAEALGLPIAENEFRKTKEKPLPEPPYVIWYEDEQGSDGADKAVLIKKRNMVLELYTDKVGDKGIENRIEKEVLYDIGHKKYQAPVEGEDLVQTAYSFTVTEKVPRAERIYG